MNKFIKTMELVTQIILGKKTNSKPKRKKRKYKRRAKK
tara:strand:+ start:131 stop:244 length:114 start_codon:yes stop_codon:yes gene_type:complete